MNLHRPLWRIHDSDPNNFPGCIEVPGELEARMWNAQGWGIFRSINYLEKGAPRKKEFIREIHSVAIEFDCGPEKFFLTKDGLLDHITSFCYPSEIIETKNGYHVYYRARQIDPLEYENLTKNRMIPLLYADPACSDMTRVFREPGYYHMKDPSSPFMIKSLVKHPALFSLAELEFFFRLPPEDEEVQADRAVIRATTGSIGFFDDLYSMNQADLLRRFSGHPSVSGEVFSFKNKGSNKFNILVNGKGTSAWIDSHGRIGSHSQGGPTIWQWLRWYKHDHKTVHTLLREVIPELFRRE